MPDRPLGDDRLVGSGGADRLPCRLLNVGVRADRLQFAALECPQAGEAAKPLAIQLQSMLMEHRIAVVTPQRSFHTETSLVGEPTTRPAAGWSSVPSSIVSKTLQPTQV